jgi:hypothetical protein
MANEINTLIRKLGTDVFVGDSIHVDAATVLKWRKRNRVPGWWIDKLSRFAIDQGQQYATPQWFFSINHKMSKRGRK